MKKKIVCVWIALAIAGLLSFGLGTVATAAPQGLVTEAFRLSAGETGAKSGLISVDRKQLLDDIYEYTVMVRAGAGEFDVIRIHRVVKESRPWVPARTGKAVMLVHGDASNFESSFLPGTLSNKAPSDLSLAVFLADHNVDVWGVDRRWALVPDATTDFSFMKDWNTALHVRDIRTAVKIARAVRGLTGNGFDKIFMLGHSRGAQFVYAYANEETQLPLWQRDLQGMIPVEVVYEFSPNNQELKQAACERYQGLKALYDSGIYYSNEAQGLKQTALLASIAPDEPSPVIPGFTNKQAVLFVLSATYATFTPPAAPYVPFYHYLAGMFDDSGIPTGLQFTNFGLAMDIAFATPSFESIGEIIDGEALMCGSIETPYNDHLGEIRIPVFYVGVAGGFGDYGTYTTALLGSADKKTLIVQLYPSEAAALDYGHADLLWAENAKTLVWEPVYQWINSH